MKPDLSKWRERAARVRGFLARRYISLPLAALAALGLSFAAEQLGIRAKLGIGGEERSMLAIAVVSILIFTALACRILAHGERFDGRNHLHSLLYGLILLACLGICISEAKNLGEPIDYDGGVNIGYQNIFIQQLDAFEKGQIHLDLYVDPRLESMENPYDTAERDRLGIFYHWDHAYFEGKYYSYFGLAPIISVYYPYYLLTGVLPTVEAVCMLLAAAALYFLAGALRELTIFLKASPPLPLMLLALPALAFGCGIFPGQSYSDFYYIPVLSSMCFNFAFFYLALRACRARHPVSAAFLFGGGALAFVFSVMSRPTAALICLTLTPVIFHSFFLGRKPLSARLARILPFGAVICAGAAFIMWFNYARFGSPLDFGANYQLTVNDVSTNTVTLSVLPDAIFHYFIQFPNAREVFPFYGPSFISLDYGERFVYLDATIGALFFPATAGLIICPFFYGMRERIRTLRHRDNTRTLVCACGAAIIPIIAFADFCKAGVNMRYLFDLLPLAVLLGAALLLRFAGDASPESRRSRFGFAAICLVGTLLSGLSIVLSNGADKLFFPVA